MSAHQSNLTNGTQNYVKVYTDSKKATKETEAITPLVKTAFIMSITTFVFIVGFITTSKAVKSTEVRPNIRERKFGKQNDIKMQER